MPTFERGPRFDREFRRLSRELQRAFLEALALFIEALRVKPPAFPPRLRVKRVEGSAGVWELSFAGNVRLRARAHPGRAARRVATDRRSLDPE